MFGNRLRLGRAPGGKPCGERLVFEGENRGSEESGIYRTGVADRKRANRDTRRHLHNRQERILPRQSLALYRHAEDRQERHRGRHAGQMGGAAGAGNDELEPFGCRSLSEIRESIRRAMRRNDEGFVADFESFERRRRVPHRLPIGLAAHDERDGLCGCRQGFVQRTRFCEGSGINEGGTRRKRIGSFAEVGSARPPAYKKSRIIAEASAELQQNARYCCECEQDFAKKRDAEMWEPVFRENPAFIYRSRSRS